MNIKSIFIIISGLIFSLIVIIDLMSSQGNSLGRSYLYISVAFLIVGFLLPKKSVYIVILASAYLDHFKRLLVVYGVPTQIDVVYIQSIPISLLSGAFIGSIVGVSFGKYASGKNVKHSLIASIALAVIGILPNLLGATSSVGGDLRGFGGAVNAGFYSVLIFLLPLHFTDALSVRKLLNFTIIVYIPVAIYLLKQAFFGLSDFEYNYLLTGLSQEARILWEQNALRGFSTMSGASVVSVVTSIFGVIVLYPIKSKEFNDSQTNFVTRILCSLTFFAAAWYTASRGGWFCGVATALALICFRKKSTTLLLYLSGLILFIVVIAVAPYLHDHRILDDWQLALDSNFKSAVGNTNDHVDRALVLGTFYDRILGWKNLTQRPDIWTPFGFALAGKVVDWQKDMIGHDITIDLLLRFGFVPIAAGLSLLTAGLYKIHQYILKLKSESLEKKITVVAFSLAVGIFVGGFGNGAQLRVFPQNLFFFMFIGMVLSIYLNRNNKDYSQSSQSQSMKLLKH